MTITRPYTDFRYVYPPRPEQTLPPSGLGVYEGQGFLGQPKLDGTAAVTFLGPSDTRIYNRHARALESKISIGVLRDALGGKGWNVYAGEYLNKAKAGPDGKVPPPTLVIFDILVHEGTHLLGTTLEERVVLMDDVLGTRSHSEFLYEVSGPVLRVKSFDSGFRDLYDRLVVTPLFEGVVLKRRGGKLEPGLREFNNTTWEAKCRRETKNYKF